MNVVENLLKMSKIPTYKCQILPFFFLLDANKEHQVDLVLKSYNL